MQLLKAHVKNGRVVLDEPLELPEDTELEVGSLHVVDTGDDFDDEERGRLHQALGPRPEASTIFPLEALTRTRLGLRSETS
jgi:hypothetical protein